jgi:hypothetical protein
MSDDSIGTSIEPFFSRSRALPSRTVEENCLSERPTVLTRSARRRLIRTHRQRAASLEKLVESDRLWFANRPVRIVRFRPQRPGDFVLMPPGQEPPCYVPSQLAVQTSLTWVAVVDVCRALGLPSGDVGLRVRMRTVPIRSRRLQTQMAEEFAIAVCRDLLDQLQGQNPAA